MAGGRSGEIYEASCMGDLARNVETGGEISHL